MKTLQTRVARVLFGFPFIVFGLMHLALAGQFAMALPSWFPLPVIGVYLTGVVLIVGGGALVTNRYASTGAYAVAGFLFVTILLVQIPGLGAEDPMMQQMAMSGLLKDIMLLGAALWFSRALSESATS